MGTDIFSIALDALMVVAISGLWVMWFLQAGQRKKVEKMLSEASDELQAATKLLDQVMENIVAQKTQLGDIAEQAETPKITAPESPKRPKTKASSKPKVAQKSYVDLDKKVEVETESKISKPLSNAAYSAQIMRLSREGLSAEAISDELGVPVAQVRLMQLLQTPKV